MKLLCILGHNLGEIRNDIEGYYAICKRCDRCFEVTDNDKIEIIKKRKEYDIRE